MSNKIANNESERKNSLNLALKFDASIKMLQSGNVSLQLDGLVSLHKMWMKQDSKDYKNLQQLKGEELMKVLQETLEELFDRERPKIPYKFTDYFLKALQKFSSQEQFFRVPITQLQSYVQAILFKLLEEDKNKIVNEQNGGTFVKSLNGCMLRILENSRPNDMFLVLFNLLI